MPAKTKKTPKKAAKKVTGKTTKKTAAKKTTTKKRVAKKTIKKTAAKKTARKAAVKKTVAASKASPSKTAPKSAEVSRTSAAADKKSTAIVFSLDDVEELVASKKAKVPTKKAARKTLKPRINTAKKKIFEDKPVEKRVLGAASLADILGFNPAEKKKNTELGDTEVPKKWKKYYKLLIKLREHVSDEISLHTSNTLKHSSREDSGDLSAYGNHQADAGTDTFDRDFALSLVSGEQDALIEIEEAIIRIKDGSYGVCEVTGKAIPAARLTAVPFARFSVEGQIEHEKNLHHKRDRSIADGIFGDVADVPKIETDDE